MNTDNDKLERARLLHQNRRHEEAEAGYRELLGADADDTEVLFYLGCLLCETQRLEEGRDKLARVLELNPSHVGALANLATWYLLHSEWQKAEELFRSALRIAPSMGDWYGGIATTRVAQNDFAGGAVAYYQATLRRPRTKKAHFGLGYCHYRLGEFEESLAAYRKVVEIDPSFVNGQFALGSLLIEMARADEALGPLGVARQLAPARLDVRTKIAHGLSLLGRHGEAESACREVIEADPNFAEAWSVLGGILSRIERDAEAEAAHRTSIELDPKSADARYNEGLMFLNRGDDERAETSFRFALELAPSNREYRYHLWSLLLRSGQSDEGLEEYARWRAGDAKRAEDSKAWDGSSIPDRTLLLTSNGSRAETLCLARYLPAIKARSSAHVVLETPADLVDYLRQFRGADLVISESRQPSRADGPFHFEASLLAAAALCGLSLSDPLPCQADVRFGSQSANPTAYSRIRRVAVHWSSHPKDDLVRIGLPSAADFAPLSETRNASLILCRSEAGSMDAELECILPFESSIDCPNTAMDLAAAAEGLDALITPDPTFAVIAATQGVRAMLLLPFVAPWIWGFAGAQTPWYPTMRLCRQPARRDWSSAIRSAIEAVSD